MATRTLVSFPGKHAIITGGSSGIGLATATLLASRGVHISLIARTASRLDEAATALRAAHPDVTVLTRSADVADRDAVFQAINELTDPTPGIGSGPCDILITAAGLAHPGYFQDLPDELFRETMDVDYFGTLWPIRAVVASMTGRLTGSIVGVSSAAGLVGIFGYTAYAPAKFAVRGLLEALRQELEPHGVHVACEYPPDVDTPQHAYENRFKPAETRAISGTIRPLTADAVAATIVAGIEHRRFAIIPDVQTKIVARTVGLVPEVFHAVFDASVRRARRD